MDARYPPSKSEPLIRESRAHWRTTLLLIMGVLVIGLLGKVHWSLPEWSRNLFQSQRRERETLDEALRAMHARNWQSALNSAVSVIHENSDSAEAYHIAGAAAGQIFGLRSKESRFYYEKYSQLEPDPSKKAFVKEIFPELILN